MKNSTIMCATKMIAKRKNVDFTLREIAKTLGVSHVAVFNHFDDKSAIVSEIAKNGFIGLIQEMKSKITIQSGVLDCARAYLMYGFNNPGEFRAMFHHSIKPFTNNLELLAVASQSYEILKSEVDKMKPGAPAAMALSIWGISHGLTSLLLDNQIDGALDSETSKSVDLAIEALEIAVLGIMSTSTKMGST